MREKILLIVVFLFLPAISWAEPTIKPGDRISFLGGTFVERMQIHGHFEAELRTRLGSDAQIRNLGWAGDNVLGESRAVFGNVQKGMERLIKDMELTRPTVIVICYGGNEAHAGLEGLDAFRDNLAALVTKLDKFGARYIFVAPRPYENLGAPLPDPQKYNSMLAHYAAVIEQIANQTKSHFVDLAKIEPIVTEQVLTSSSENGPWFMENHAGLTSNGVHLTSYGYWRLASSFAEAIGLKRKPLRIVAEDKSEGLTGLTITNTNGQVLITGTPKQLPLSFNDLVGGRATPGISIQLKDLPNAIYELKTGGKIIGVFSEKQLAAGITIPVPTPNGQGQALRNAIVNKNMLFFHRHRPQNETYLFLFRKHEQGNNAVEIPQFDPLVKNHDRKIYDLTSPSKFSITISPQNP